MNKGKFLFLVLVASLFVVIIVIPLIKSESINVNLDVSAKVRGLIDVKELNELFTGASEALNGKVLNVTIKSISKEDLKGLLLEEASGRTINIKNPEVQSLYHQSINESLSNIVAKYSYFDNRIYLVEENLEKELGQAADKQILYRLIAHEFIHLLQDQKGVSLVTILESNTVQDFIVNISLIEGHAQYWGKKIMEKNGYEWWETSNDNPSDFKYFYGERFFEKEKNRDDISKLLNTNISFKNLVGRDNNKKVEESVDKDFENLKKYFQSCEVVETTPKFYQAFLFLSYSGSSGRYLADNLVSLKTSTIQCSSNNMSLSVFGFQADEFKKINDSFIKYSIDVMSKGKDSAIIVNKSGFNHYLQSNSENNNLVFRSYKDQIVTELAVSNIVYFRESFCLLTDEAPSIIKNICEL